jgi:hypothetical protein
VAVPNCYFDDEDARRDNLLADCHRDALTVPRWSETTLCGREWAVMVGGDGAAMSRYGEVAFAPTCRRCQVLVDRDFPRR